MADDNFDPTVLDEAEVDPAEAAAELAAAEAEAEAAAELAANEAEAEAVAAEAAEIAAAELVEAEAAAAEAKANEAAYVGSDDELTLEAADAAWELARVPAQSRVPGANPLDTVPAQSRINPDGSEIAR